MFVTKRDGTKEDVKLYKIETRLKRLKYIDGIDEKPISVDVGPVAVKVAQGLFDGVTTKELDKLAAETSASMAPMHPDYDIIASRIEVSSLHKDTDASFSTKMTKLKEVGIISDLYYDFVLKNKNYLDSIVDYNRDYLLEFFGLRTLMKSYLLRDKKGNIIERPQDMFLRVASFVNMDSLDDIKKSYDLLSQKFFTHATPTLFNAGTVRPQLSSCFLLDMHEDSIPGIYKTLSDCAVISQSAGGIGLAVHKIRSKGSHIVGTNGTSNGIVPMLRVFDTTARYVDQGGGKRKGSFAMYIEPWHADIFDFLELKKNHGKEELRARDLFYALWIPDLFMERVRDNQGWSLIDPKNSGKLYELYGDEFKKQYEELEKSGKIVKTIKARELWDKILDSQIETGTPYMLYKDSSNLKNNQSNLGTIKSSNLCAEIMEFTSPEETAVCNLASISLSSFVKNDGTYDYESLYNVSRFVTKSLAP